MLPPVLGEARLLRSIGTKEGEAMHSWKEFDLTPKGIEDWISWYALTRENVMRCKDGSVLGMIRYQPFEKEQDEDPQEIALLTHLSKGWTLWIDDTFTGKETVHTLFLSWNPFYTMGGKTENGISGNVTKDYEVDQAFALDLEKFKACFPKEANPTILCYQAYIDSLMQSLTIGRCQKTMPAVPVDLDVYLTYQLPFDFSKNQVHLGDEVFLVLSVPSAVGQHTPAIQRTLFGLREAGLPYRHVERILCFSKKEAQKEYTKYMERWCPSRQYMQDFLTEDLHGNLYGWYNHQIILLIPSVEYARAVQYITKIFYEEGMLFQIEDFDAKDFWWGALPGIFRAGLKPPICSFESIKDLLKTKEKKDSPASQESERKGNANVSTEPIP